MTARRQVLAFKITIFLLTLSVLTCECRAEESEQSSSIVTDYGADVSWPMHHDFLTSIHENRLLKSQRAVYRHYMEGCYEAFDQETCDENEEDRIVMTLSQPSYQTNFTAAGYAKVNTPVKAYQVLKQFWDRYNKVARRKEVWDDANIHCNHWEVPTEIVDWQDEDNLHVSRSDRRELVVDEVRKVLERWSGSALIETSVFGIRVYKRNAILAPHVDRMPLVISAIINVAQEVDEDWILEIIGHDGMAVNVTMKPGEMILYESHSIIHGRPYPLNGDYYANIFMHFEPIGYTEELEQRIKKLYAKEMGDRELFQRAMANQDAADRKKHPPARRLPHYIKEGSKEAEMWRQEYVFSREETEKETKKKSYRVKGVTDAHVVAANGDLTQLQKVEKKDPESLLQADSNDWKPIHEAARSGKTEIVEYLIKKGADVNERTNDGKGANPLWWARQQLPDNHPTILLLQRHGAIAIAPNQ